MNNRVLIAAVLPRAAARLRAASSGRWMRLAVTLMLGAALSPAARPARASDIVYVESNIGMPGENSVFAFRRGADGSLTPLPGSPFRTGGTGVFDTTLALGPFDSDQNLITDEDGAHLFAVNSGSNTIAVFDILTDGALVPVKDSPFDSGGVNPVSVGLADRTLVVVNKNQDVNQNPVFSLPNYTTFHVTRKGELIPVPDSTIPLAQGSSPSQALISPDSHHLFGADFLGGLLQSFVLRAGGHLSQNTPQGLPASEFIGSTAPRLPLGLATHPTLPLLYVGFVTISRVGVYAYDEKGELTFIDTMPNSGAAVCWIRVNGKGTRLYTANTGDNSISVYDLSDPLFPVEIQKVTLKGNGNPFQITLGERDRYLYVVSQRGSASLPVGEGNFLHVLQVDSHGLLTEVASSPTALSVPPGTRPQGVAAVSR
jgi:6-phosphogluconolactonase (cycloisomerase 2 family)